MKKIIIKESSFPFRGYYAQEVVESGHVPGILSGSALKGNARKWSNWYYGQREKVSQWVSKNTAASEDLILLEENHRWTRVWAIDGEPVRLVIE